jgi:hypothetical protein
MVFRILDRAKMSVSGAPGTGNITLGAAVTGYQSFAQAGVLDGDTFAYSAVDGSAWEFGVATYTALTGTLTRTVTKTSAQNASPLSLSNTVIITAVLRAEDVSGNSATLATLPDVNINENTLANGSVLTWNLTAGEWEGEAPSGGLILQNNSTSLGSVTSINFVNASSITASGGAATVTLAGAGSGGGSTIRQNGTLIGSVGAFTTINFVDAASITTSVGGTQANVTLGGGGGATLNALTDVTVTEGSGIDGYSLTWNNSTGKWVATNVSGGGGGGSSLAVLNNGSSVETAAVSLNFINATSITTSGHAVTITLPTGSGGSSTLSGLSDVSVTEGSGINGYVLYWNNGASKWEAKALATVATSGAYSDLSGTPSLATVATSGSYTDLTSKPTSASWSLASLGDVSITTGSGVDGYCVYWNNGAGKFELKSVSGGGTSLSGLTTDVLISSPADGQVLTYEASSSKWKNKAPATVGFTVGTPPTVVQFATATANGSDAAVTMGAAPTNGNFLVAILYSDNTTPVAASGWTVQASVSVGLWYCYILTKIAGASESTSQNPLSSGGGGHWSKGIWEVSGQNATSPVLFASASQFGSSANVAQTITIPQATSTLFLASLAPSQSQANTLTSIFGIANVDANLTSAAGAHAAYAHCDSNNPTYGMLGVMSTAAQFNQAFVLITH